MTGKFLGWRDPSVGGGKGNDDNYFANERDGVTVETVDEDEIDNADDVPMGRDSYEVAPAKLNISNPS